MKIRMIALLALASLSLVAGFGCKKEAPMEEQPMQEQAAAPEAAAPEAAPEAPAEAPQGN
ncbi:MAG TPA: hypothetical protein P5079_00455 [Elusimicrobiota bacterium]|nr:hypothetical protein [Elusimicrobiota bacterium]